MRTFVILTILAVSISFADGTYMDTTLVPPSLGFETPIRIYLPEGYDPSGTIDYPVIYWLHGWGSTQTKYSYETKAALDSLISSQQIQPVIVVKPNGWCEPYDGSCWVNSELYGDYEDYVVYDLVSFIDSTFCAISDPEYRCIAGHSMGCYGSLHLALAHTDRYKAVAAHAGPVDLVVAMPIFIPLVLDECPESEPPYSYDPGNGPFTENLFCGSGAMSPNLTNPPYYVDFILDDNGEVIDSLYALWEPFYPIYKVKQMSPPIDLDIYLECGENDNWPATYECCCSFSDTLTELGIEHVFQITPGAAHPMTIGRFIEEFLFLGEAMTGIEDAPMTPPLIALGSVIPNPFTSATEIQFNLPEATHVSLQVYDVSGRMVRSLLDEELGAGLHSIVLKGEDLTPGLYIFVLRTGADIESKSCVFLR